MIGTSPARVIGPMTLEAATARSSSSTMLNPGSAASSTSVDSDLSAEEAMMMNLVDENVKVRDTEMRLSNDCEDASIETPHPMDAVTPPPGEMDLGDSPKDNPRAGSMKAGGIGKRELCGASSNASSPYKSESSYGEKRRRNNEDVTPTSREEDQKMSGASSERTGHDYVTSTVTSYSSRDMPPRQNNAKTAEEIDHHRRREAAAHAAAALSMMESSVATPMPTKSSSKQSKSMGIKIDPFSLWSRNPRYELRKILGHGSYGQVAEAWDKITNERVAIKRITCVFDQEVDTKRILREVYILRRLKHENVVRLLNIFIPGGKTEEDFNEIYLVFDFVDTDLHKLINSPQYLTIDHVKTFLYQLLCALKYIHSSLVIHRDIKPANILLNENCALKVCDFGLARVVSPSRLHGTGTSTMLPPTSIEAAAATAAASSSPIDHRNPSETDGNENPNNSSRHQTESRSHSQEVKSLRRQLTKHVVTRWYRPPELILLQEYTHAVDMWSVGCIFAELLSMEKASVASFKERAPLFPGKSCFPLSADSDKTYKDELDQLNVIFGVIGTPEEDDIKDLGDVKHYLRGLPKKPRSDFGKIFKAAPREALDLLNRMLVFNPQKRISVDQALEHEFLSSVRIPGAEVVASHKLDMDFESLNRSQLKAIMIDEIRSYVNQYGSS